MSAEDIRDYVIEQLNTHGDNTSHLVEMGSLLSGHPKDAGDLQPLLQGLEAVIDQFQSLHDRCCEMFPDAEADGKTDPTLAYLREQIRKWHIIWEGWNMPIP